MPLTTSDSNVHSALNNKPEREVQWVRKLYFAKYSEEHCFDIPNLFNTPIDFVRNVNCVKLSRQLSPPP